MKKFSFLTLVALAALATPARSLAQDYTTQLNNTGVAVYGTANPASSNLPYIVGNIINAFLSILGIYFLYLVMRSGWLWMSAQGDSKQVVEAKDTMVRAIVGLIILMAAYSITNYVIDSLGTLTA